MGELLRSLLEGLLQKDPTKRITYDDFFKHPFMMPDLPSSPLMRTQGNVGSSIGQQNGEMKTNCNTSSNNTEIIQNKQGETKKERKKDASSNSFKKRIKMTTTMTKMTAPTKRQAMNWMTVGKC